MTTFVFLRLVITLVLCCIANTSALSFPLSATALSEIVAKLANAGNGANPTLTKSKTTTSSDGPTLGGLTTRRAFMTVAAPVTILATTLAAPVSTANAQDSSPSSPYQVLTPEWGFTFTPPPDFEIGNKPLKTHLEEVNFNSMLSRGYQFGITVDPVRINSLDEVRV